MSEPLSIHPSLWTLLRLLHAMGVYSAYLSTLETWVAFQFFPRRVVCPC